MAKYNGVFPRTPQVRPKSKIYTPKRDDKHPRHFYMQVPPEVLTPQYGVMWTLVNCYSKLI